MLFSVSRSNVKTPQIRDLVVSRLDPVSGLMGGPHGAIGLRQTSRLGTPASVYRCLLWIYFIDALFCRRATIDLPHAHIVHLPARRPRLVPRQLLPHGQHGSAVRRAVGGAEGHGLD